jgi:hypothetical protein
MNYKKYWELNFVSYSIFLNTENLLLFSSTLRVMLGKEKRYSSPSNKP